MSDEWLKRETWLKSLKKGDQVFIPTRHRSGCICTVDRVTKTQIILEGSIEKFRISDGSRIGASQWNQCEIVEPTKKIFDSIKQSNLAYALSEINWKEVELDTLVEVMSVFKKSSAQKNNVE